MNYYLVIVRCEDAPKLLYLLEEEVNRYLAEDWHEYDFLGQPPDLFTFPARSVFIHKGQVVVPKPVHTVTSWTL